MKIAAFDFDHTLIDVNSDTYIDKLLIKDTGTKRFKYPDTVEDLYEKFNWTHRMNGVFEYMNKNHSISKSDLIDCLNEIKINNSMIDVIKKLYNNGYKLSVISDANTIFIETILRQNNVYDNFHKIFTNPADFDETGRLNVRPFSEIFNKDGTPFDCSTKICSTNICKGGTNLFIIFLLDLWYNILKNVFKDVLRSYIDELKTISNNELSHLIYVGDGTNDYCPGILLSENDLYFVRQNHSLSRLLQKDDLAKKIKAQTKYWQNADDILNHL
jgi:pyridoxal phosphate phosphatase PHOSPHO2